MSNKLTSRSILILVITITILYKYWNALFIVGISAIIIYGIVKAIKRIKHLRSFPFSLSTQSKTSQLHQNQGELIFSNTEKLKVEKQDLKSIKLKANNGDAQAQFELGMIYDNGYFSHGQGVLQNTTEAAKWYRLAADNGHATAQYNLGWMYYDGHGVKQDYGEALRLTRLAKKNGMPSTQARIDLIMSAEDDHSEALQWQQLKAKQDDSSIETIRDSSKDEVHPSIEELEVLQRREITANSSRNDVTTPLTDGEYKVIIAAEKLKQAKIKVEIAAEKLKQAEIRAKIKSNSQPLLSTLLSKEMRAVCQNSPEQRYSGAPSKRDTLAENVDVQNQFELGKINNSEVAIKLQIAKLLKVKIRFITQSIFSTMLAREMRTGYQISSVKNYIASPSKINVLPTDGERIMSNVPENNSVDAHSTKKDQKETILSADELWIPFGKTIEFAGYTIPDGLVYFGHGLKSITESEEEPSFIDVSLPVDKTDPDISGRNMGYWPYYSHIHPASRAAYLDWLSTGRKDPDAHIGYVFLFFYGLERRVFIDIQNDICTAEDLPIILNEVQRLLAIYIENASFRQYAHKFQEVLLMLSWRDSLYKTSPSLEFYSWCEIPLIIKAVLGQLADDRVSLPAEWALAWAINDPSMPNRMLIERCMLEFQELFKFQYTQKYKTGLLLSPNKTRLKVTYRAASPLFVGRYITILREDLSDVTDDSGAISQIQEIVNSCTDELEGYSRFIWLNPDNKYSLEATSLLPKLLLKKHVEKEFQRLMIWLEQQIPSNTPVQISFQSIVEVMPRINQNCFGKKEVISIANFLGKIGYGIEPDPRFGNFVPKQDHNVVLFRISENAPIAPSNEYSVATLVLHLASAVATADGTVNKSEKQHLEDYLETCLHLSLDDKIRLQAHMLFLLSSFPDMNNVKKRIELLQQEQKESLAKFLVCIAQADGYIDVAEMKILTRIYAMLGLDAQSLYSHVHTAAVEPVAVQTADSLTSPGYSIPAPPKISDGISLDMDKIKTIRAETNAISSILNDIFSEDQHEQITTLISDARTTDIPITGLDPESFAFMKELACKLIWTREELEKLAAVHSLMLDGTLESINDASLDHFGDLFFEGDDPVIINAQFAKEINV